MDAQDWPHTRRAIEQSEDPPLDLDDDQDEPEQGNRLLRALTDAPDGDAWIDSGSGSGWTIRFPRPNPPAE